MNLNLPRIVLAGTHSGVGKTTLTLGLLAALKRRGMKVQPFKVGPDYIDPGLHQVAAGNCSHNLDSWMGSPTEVQQLFVRRAAGSDISIVEGVMGLFDGARGQGESGSTAQVAKLLEAPVVLIMAAQGLARSAAALVKGYSTFDPGVKIIGVIANGVGSERHRLFIQETLEGELGMPLLGALQRQQEIGIPQRHLGLLPAAENTDLTNVLAKLAQTVEEQLDINRLLQGARAVSPLASGSNSNNNGPVTRVRLAVARDEAFNFYYQDSLDYLKELGAQLCFFSPLHDTKLPPDIDGIYIGGGFPEEFLPCLEGNILLKQQLKECYHQALPIYAECGGLMYLCSTITNLAGQTFAGVGLVPARVKMGQRLAALGYVRARLINSSLLGEVGHELKGHEFHWSTITELPPTDLAYCLVGGRGQDGRVEGYARGSLLASYVHLHFRYNQRAARNLLVACANFRSERGKVHG